MLIIILAALIALVIGLALLIRTKKNKGNSLAKKLAYIISIIAIIVIIITFSIVGFKSFKMGHVMMDDHTMHDM